MYATGACFPDVYREVKELYNIQYTSLSYRLYLGRGPRRGAVAHVRRKVIIGYNGVPQMRPQKYPFPWTDPQTPTTCLIAGPVRPMMPNGIRIQFAVFSECTGQTDRPTERPRESLTTIGRCATRATRPNKATLIGDDNYDRLQH